jgi:hypothetical protein
VGALAGCVDPNENAASLYDGQPVFAAAVTAAPRQNPGTASGNAVPAEGERNAAAEPKVAALTPPAAPKTDSGVDADPKRLIGLDRSALTALLGRPAFERKDRPAEFWRYNGESCMLDLYLYGPTKAAEKDKTVRVRHVAAHGPHDSPADIGDCLRGILRARLASSTD